MKLLILIFYGLLNSINGDLTNVCYDDYGCFSIAPPFFDVRARPLTLLPQNPEKIATKFYLYTRQNVDGVQVDAKHLSEHFILNTKTRFIIHGFLHNAFKPWVMEMKDALLKNNNENIISVDWSKGNFFPYTQATANTRIVGVDVAKFINSHISKGLMNADDIHIIGHSLGSHIAGYAGERISPQIGRITGLDPAGPYFENADVRVRLDPTDAKFVDAIHTDGTEVASLIVGYGLLQSVGHVDFYPNGGRNQPNCPITPNKLFSTMSNIMTVEMREVEDLVACAHISAVYFFTDSILNTNCGYAAYKCQNLSDFKAGNCIKCSAQGCNQMGFHASPSKELGSLYVTTQSADSAPYCLKHYQVTLKSADLETKVETKGKFTLLVKGSLRNSDAVVIDDSLTAFKSGQSIIKLIDAKNNIGHLESATLTFNKPFCIFFTCWYHADKWNFEKIIITDGENQESVELCPTSTLASGSSVDFKRC